MSEEEPRDESIHEEETQHDEISSDGELQTRLIERLEGDVNITKENNFVESTQTIIPEKPIRKKGKDWSFIDTKEFKSASNQKVEFVGRSPRVKNKINYSREQTILWLDF